MFLDWVKVLGRTGQGSMMNEQFDENAWGEALAKLVVEEHQKLVGRGILVTVKR